MGDIIKNNKIFNSSFSYELNFNNTLRDTIRMAALGISDSNKSYANESVKYADSRAGQFSESWTNTNNWATNTNLQVSSNKLYSKALGASSGMNHSYALNSNETLRCLTTLNVVAGLSSGGVIIGVSNDSAGSNPASAGTSARGIYFDGTGVYTWNQGSTTLVTGSSGVAAAGTYYITIIVDSTNISVIATLSTGATEYRTKISRSGFNINNLYLFNSDSRQLTGWNIGLLSAVKSISTITPRTGFEDIIRTTHWTTVTANSQSCNIKIEVPLNYDSRIPMPVAICFHGNGSDENLFTDNSNSKLVGDALLSAGYIVLSAAYTPNTSTWGAQPSLDTYYEAYKIVRDNYNIGPIVIYGVSMGALEGLLTLAERRIPGIVAFCGTSSVTNLQAAYTDSNTFTTTINSAYSINGGNPYATATLGHDPNLKTGDSFRGVPMLFIVASDDIDILPSNNTNKFVNLVDPYCDVTLVTTTGGHSFNPGPFTSQITTFFNTYIKG